MSDDIMYVMLGAFGLLALLAFVRPQEPAVAVRPPSQEVQRRIWEQIEAPVAPTPVAPTQVTNACGADRFGYPDFTGTPRAGSPCVDSIDCQLHPPAGHPEYQECCVEDGTCFTR